MWILHAMRAPTQYHLLIDWALLECHSSRRSTAQDLSQQRAALE